MKITLDSLRIKVDLSALKSKNEDYFRDSYVSDKYGEILYHRSVFNKQDNKQISLGINSISENEDQGILTFDISSKLLGDRYLELLHKDNIEYVIQRINRTKIIELDPNKVIDEGKVSALDITQDLKTKNDILSIKRDLLIYSGFSNYHSKKYKTGIELYGFAPSNKERLKVYSKYHEFLSNKFTNKELAKHIAAEKLKDIIRVEADMRKPEYIRKYFKINKEDKLLLSRLLSSETPVLKYFFNKILPPKTIDKDIINPLESEIPPSEVEKEIGKRAIIKHCNYDRKILRDFLKSKLKGGNPIYYMKKYDRILAEMIGEKSDGNFKTIEEIRTKLIT
jgi:hypothetical protein